MRHLLFSLTALCILTFVVSCNAPKKGDVIQVDLEQVLEQNLRDSTLVTGWYYIANTENGFKRQLDKTDDFYFIDPKPILVKEHFSKVEIYATEDFKEQFGHPFALAIMIGKDYKDIWANATEKSTGKWMALIIDNMLVSAPKVMMKIENGKSSLNRGVYTKEELESFIEQIGLLEE